MVTSISVDLQATHQLSSYKHSKLDQVSARFFEMLTKENGKYIPKGAQEPIVDDPK